MADYLTADNRLLIISRLFAVSTKKLILLNYLSYLFRLRLLADCYLLEGLQSAEKTKRTQKQSYKRTHFYQKQKPLSCFKTNDIHRCIHKLHFSDM